MRQSAAAWLIEIVLTVRVFGPDAVRGVRRLLVALVRMGIATLGGTARRAPAGREDGRPEVKW
ncbi:hypothetical protein [Streptomyces luteireticuli]|uniref:Uncharacterized protein n=1 Tax=Streptomyces luteireticuli TaxID=173858 RepID=A0ABN0YM14_9ACTN